MRLYAIIAALGSVLAAPFLIAAQAPAAPAGEIPAEVELQLGDLLAAEARFRDAADAYQRAAAAADAAVRRRARAGLALSLLRVGDFDGARNQAEALVKEPSPQAALYSLYGDTLWAVGLFD